MKKLGPAKFLPDILKRLSDGEPLAQICREEGMPSQDTVREWARADDAIAKQYELARLDGAEAIAQRARMTLRGKGPDAGGESTGDTFRDKAIAEFDLKLLAKWHPKDWGDRLQQEHSGTVAVNWPLPKPPLES